MPVSCSARATASGTTCAPGNRLVESFSARVRNDSQLPALRRQSRCAASAFDVGLLQTEFLHPVPNLIPMQPEQRRGPRLVAVGALERLRHQHLFDVIEIHAVRRKRKARPDELPSRRDVCRLSKSDRLQRLALRQQNSPLDEIPQLADVARPAIGAWPASAAGLNDRTGRLNSRANTPTKCWASNGRVLPAVAERRNLDAQHVQPVIQVFAELARPDLLLEICDSSRRSRARRPDVHRSRRPDGTLSLRETGAAWLAGSAPSRRFRRGRPCPSSACSSRPRFCWRASVKAPRSCPNISDSSRCSGMADDVTLTNGRAARSLT